MNDIDGDAELKIFVRKRIQSFEALRWIISDQLQSMAFDMEAKQIVIDTINDIVSAIKSIKRIAGTSDDSEWIEIFNELIKELDTFIALLMGFDSPNTSVH